MTNNFELRHSINGVSQAGWDGNAPLWPRYPTHADAVAAAMVLFSPDLIFEIGIINLEYKPPYTCFHVSNNPFPNYIAVSLDD